MPSQLLSNTTDSIQATVISYVLTFDTIDFRKVVVCVAEVLKIVIKYTK